MYGSLETRGAALPAFPALAGAGLPARGCAVVAHTSRGRPGSLSAACEHGVGQNGNGSLIQLLTVYCGKIYRLGEGKTYREVANSDER
jgi:hypothetical protein